MNEIPGTVETDSDYFKLPDVSEKEKEQEVGDSGGAAVDNGYITCSVCTFMNEPNALMCDVCEAVFSNNVEPLK
jgi:hypothetical protein